MAVQREVDQDQGDRGSGAGSGGAIHLLAPTINGSGVLNALGGVDTYFGQRTSAGRIRLEAFQHGFTGQANPTALLRAPMRVFIQPVASVRIVDVAGVAMTDRPMGEFVNPDTTINTSSTVTVTVEGRHVPIGSTVQLYLLSEDGPDQIVNSTPLTGTFVLSTATVTATFPTGYSRMFVRSDWTP